MSTLPPEDLLGHILDEADYLTRRSSAIEYDAFVRDEDLRRAFVRSLEIIGEATRRLDAEFRARYPDIEWRRIAGTRDRLIHDDEGVDYELAWSIVRTHIPGLVERIRAILGAR